MDCRIRQTSRRYPVSQLYRGSIKHCTTGTLRIRPRGISMNSQRAPKRGKDPGKLLQVAAHMVQLESIDPSWVPQFAKITAFLAQTEKLALFGPEAQLLQRTFIKIMLEQQRMISALMHSMLNTIMNFIYRLEAQQQDHDHEPMTSRHPPWIWAVAPFATFELLSCAKFKT